MEKVTLKLSGKIFNNYSDSELHCSLDGMELTGTPLQIGLLYHHLVLSQVLIVGYSFLSFIRASSVLNRQLILVRCSFL